MTTSFKRRFRVFATWLAAPFILLFIFRLLYGYIVITSAAGYDYSRDFFSSMGHLRKNYASEKMVLKSNVQQQAEIASAQKYEKTATIKSKTSQFEKDQADTRKATGQFNAVVQYEQSLGNKGNRELHLLIGVNPASFDSFYLALQKIGTIKATEITKVDKTNEYRQLNAKKASLEKILASLEELKSKSGQIADYISLHDKILEIETSLQELGVELGNFNTENEFCTVRFSLYEGAPKQEVGLFTRVKTATEWTIKYYAMFILSLLGLLGASFILLLLIDKLNIIGKISKKIGGG
ncbi:MAG TPA: DUF4349 domain-containing protein [Chitinophagaceae bacterium]|jgi:hypothetical protein